MKSKKRKLTQVAVLALAGLTLMAAPAAAMRGRAGGGQRGMGRGMGPSFTEAQQEQIKKIHAKYSDERAELTNRLKVIMVEAHDVDSDAAPDYKAIERNIEEAAEVRVKLAKLRLQVHKEIRPMLDDDQKVLFDRGLATKLHSSGGPGSPGMMGRRGGMGRGGAMGRDGAMRGSGVICRPGAGGTTVRRIIGGPGAMVREGEMTPWCPFADDAGDDM